MPLTHFSRKSTGPCFDDLVLIYWRVVDWKVLEPFRTYVSIALLQNRGGFNFPLSPHNLSSHEELQLFNKSPSFLHIVLVEKKYSARV